MWNPFRARPAAALLDIKPDGGAGRLVDNDTVRAPGAPSWSELLTRQQTMTNDHPVDRYLLRGLVYCGPCGKPRVPALDDGRRVYRCADAGCRTPLVSAEETEQAVWAKVAELNREAVKGITRHGRRDLLVAVLRSVTTTYGGLVFQWHDR